MTIKNLLILLISVITLSSCAFTEEIHVKKDGSGSYAFKMDLSKMMEAMGEMGNHEGDSIKKKTPEKRDTLIHFKDVLDKMKDSIKKLPADEREVLETLKDLKLQIKMDETEKQMNMDFIYDFKNFNDLKNINERIQKAQSLNDKKMKQAGAFESNSDVTYSFNNKTFKRNVILKKQTEEEKEAYKNYLEQSAAMFEGSTYKIVYHFESKVKSVSIDGAKISEDGKTVTLEMPFDKVMKDPLLLNFEVKLK